MMELKCRVLYFRWWQLVIAGEAGTVFSVILWQ